MILEAKLVSWFKISVFKNLKHQLVLHFGLNRNFACQLQKQVVVFHFWRFYKETFLNSFHFQLYEKMDTTNNDFDTMKFLKKFHCDTCVLKTEQTRQLEDFLVEYNDVLAKLRFDIGYNKELKIKLTSENQLPLYVQYPSASIHLRDKNFDELAILQSFYTITTLSYSKCSSPIFIQLKSSDKLRLFDLGRVNHILRLG